MATKSNSMISPSFMAKMIRTQARKIQDACLKVRKELFYDPAMGFNHNIGGVRTRASVKNAEARVDNLTGGLIRFKFRSHRLLWFTIQGVEKRYVIECANKWNYELKDTIIVQGRTARMGGDFFKCDDVLYRPAQDNNDCYGGALILQKVVVENGKWKFLDVRRLTSPHPQYTTGLHTFNSYKGTTVVDIHGYRKHPLLSHLLTKMINMFRTRR